jgi:hypothetical protein
MALMAFNTNPHIMALTSEERNAVLPVTAALASIAQGLRTAEAQTAMPAVSRQLAVTLGAQIGSVMASPVMASMASEVKNDIKTALDQLVIDVVAAPTAQGIKETVNRFEGNSAYQKLAGSEKAAVAPVMSAVESMATRLSAAEAHHAAPAVSTVAALLSRDSSVDAAIHTLSSAVQRLLNSGDVTQNEAGRSLNAAVRGIVGDLYRGDFAGAVERINVMKTAVNENAVLNNAVAAGTMDTLEAGLVMVRNNMGQLINKTEAFAAATAKENVRSQVREALPGVPNADNIANEAIRVSENAAAGRVEAGQAFHVNIEGTRHDITVSRDDIAQGRADILSVIEHRINTGALNIEKSLIPTVIQGLMNAGAVFGSAAFGGVLPYEAAVSIVKNNETGDAEMLRATPVINISPVSGAITGMGYVMNSAIGYNTQVVMQISTRAMASDIRGHTGDFAALRRMDSAGIMPQTNIVLERGTSGDLAGMTRHSYEEGAPSLERFNHVTGEYEGSPGIGLFITDSRIDSYEKSVASARSLLPEGLRDEKGAFMHEMNVGGVIEHKMERTLTEEGMKIAAMLAALADTGAEGADKIREAGENIKAAVIQFSEIETSEIAINGLKDALIRLEEAVLQALQVATTTGHAIDAATAERSELEESLASAVTALAKNVQSRIKAEEKETIERTEVDAAEKQQQLEDLRSLGEAAKTMADAPGTELPDILSQLHALNAVMGGLRGMLARPTGQDMADARAMRETPTLVDEVLMTDAVKADENVEKALQKAANVLRSPTSSGVEAAINALEKAAPAETASKNIREAVDPVINALGSLREGLAKGGPAFTADVIMEASRPVNNVPKILIIDGTETEESGRTPEQAEQLAEQQRAMGNIAVVISKDTKIKDVVEYINETAVSLGHVTISAMECVAFISDTTANERPSFAGDLEAGLNDIGVGRMEFILMGAANWRQVLSSFVLWAFSNKEGHYLYGAHFSGNAQARLAKFAMSDKMGAASVSGDVDTRSLADEDFLSLIDAEMAY